ncbi:MAG: S8 family serine peptidase [Candidatus Zixiibacteriota bacterium]
MRLMRFSLILSFFILICGALSAGNIPNDPYFETHQWYLWNTGQTGGTPGADNCWLPASWITMGSSDQRIMIVNTGIAINDNNKLCNIDLNDTNRIILGTAYDTTYGDLPRDWLDEMVGHGTGMAGLAGAEGNNGEEIIGFCPECELYIVSDGLYAFLNGLEEAANNDVDVIVSGANYGSLDPDSLAYLEYWADSLEALGIFIVVPATALYNELASSGDHNNFISVNQSNEKDSTRSNIWYDDPDARITITASNGHTSTCACCDTTNHPCGDSAIYVHSLFSGECFSVPQVGGLIALLKDYHNDTLTVNQIRMVLENSADKVWQWPKWPPYDTTGVWVDSTWHPQYGSGRMNAFRALTYFKEGIAGYIRKDSTLSGTVTVFGDLIVGAGSNVTLASGMSFSFDTGDMFQSTLGFDTSVSELLIDGGFVYDAASGGIAGHITADTTWSDTIRIIGDVVIDSGVTVTVDSNFVFVIESPSIFQSPLGNDPDSSELILTVVGEQVRGYIEYEDPPCGDANGDGSINVGDINFIIDYVFHGGPAPNPLSSGDVNGDNAVNIGDGIYLTKYIFQFGPPPVCFYW